MNALHKMLARGRRLRKLGLPPQSSNGNNGGELADDGATGTFADQSVPSQRTTPLGSRNLTSISDGRLPDTYGDGDAIVAALKAIVKASPNQF